MAILKLKANYPKGRNLAAIWSFLKQAPMEVGQKVVKLEHHGTCGVDPFIIHGTVATEASQPLDRYRFRVK